MAISNEHEYITLAHGAGGKISQELMEQVILPEFGNPILNEMHDGARGQYRQAGGVRYRK